MCLQCEFKIAISISNPTKCEVHAVIRFLHTKEETAAEIHYQFIYIYDENVMTWQNMT